jgi:nitrous oxidase accessory protein NosD
MNPAFRRMLYLLIGALLLFHPVRGIADEAQATDAVASSWHDLWGVFYVPLTPVVAADLKVAGTGRLVTAVAVASAADHSGLKRGDVLRQWDTVQSADATVAIQYSRGNETQTTTLTTRRHDLREQQFGVRSKRPHPATLIIDPAGGGDYRTVTAGLISASLGDTVEISAGVYHESIIVPGGVTLRRKPGAAVHLSSQTCPVLVCGAADVTLEGLSLGGVHKALLIRNSRNLEVRGCALAATGNDVVDCTNSDKVRINECRITGSKPARGLLLSESKCVLNASIVANCKTAVEAQKLSEVQCVGNLIEANMNGIIAVNSELTASGNSITGLGSGIGISLNQANCELLENSVRKHECGVEIVQANGTVADNSLSENNDGMRLRSGQLKVVGNVVMGNRQHGVFVGSPAQGKDAALPVVLERNTIANNGAVGILAMNCQATIAFNLIDENAYGISVASGTAKLDHNTIVNNNLWGVVVGEQATVSIENCAIAFNHVGIFADVTSKVSVNRNAVFGHLAEKGSTLTDGNYARRDRLVISTGQAVPIWIFPAHDLRSPQDINEDPQFVQASTDYRLQAGSPLVVNDVFSGAFAPVASEVLLENNP